MRGHNTVADGWAGAANRNEKDNKDVYVKDDNFKDADDEDDEPDDVDDDDYDDDDDDDDDDDVDDNQADVIKTKKKTL